MEQSSSLAVRRVRAHYLVQFHEMPGAGERAALEERGARILEYIPDNAFWIAAAEGINLEGLNIRWYGELEAAQKLSPTLLAAAPGLAGSAESATAAGSDMPITLVVVAEIQRDVNPADARRAVVDEGAEIIENPDMSPRQLLIRGSREVLFALAGRDEFTYVFPASQELAALTPVYACRSGLNLDWQAEGSPASSLAVSFGDGWDGPGKGPATLRYYFGNLTPALPSSSIRTEIEKALAEWSKVVQVDFTASTSPGLPGAVDILFGARDHGDGNPFDGPGRTLAHTYFPPPNPDPIAGDMHFDSDESWRIGNDVDLYSVALHELGHALGLGHSDDPAAVMYPYYRKYTALTASDIDAVRELYAARTGTTPPVAPAPAPVTLQITSPSGGTAFQSTAGAAVMTGTASPAASLLRIEWRNTRGGSGIAQGVATWTTQSIALQIGVNVIEVAAVPKSGARVTSTITITRTEAPARDMTPPSLTITSPAQNTLVTSAPSVVVRGTAKDNVGVTAVSWNNSTGSSGNAIGTENWTTPAIPLVTGTNVITIRARDATGNQTWRTVIVTRR